MARFFTRRLLLMAFTLFLVSVLVFALSQVLPGDVGRVILGPYASKSQVAALDRHLGADQPLPAHYVHWLGQFVTGNWGKSYLLATPVRPLVLRRLWASVQLGLVATVVIVPFSIAAGILIGLREGGFLDRFVSTLGLSLIAIPEFVSGVILIVLLSVELKWFPVSAQFSSGASILDRLHHLFLPAIPLMFGLFGYLARMARAGTLEVVESAYFRTAVLKGLPTGRIVIRHVLRNALPPTITVTAIQVAGLVGGLVVVETLFNYPGIGNLLYTSAVGHDVPVVQAATLLIGGIIMAANLVADLSYGFLNPRVRLEAA